MTWRADPQFPGWEYRLGRHMREHRPVGGWSVASWNVLVPQVAAVDGLVGGPDGPAVDELDEADGLPLSDLREVPEEVVEGALPGTMPDDVAEEGLDGDMRALEVEPTVGPVHSFAPPLDGQQE